MRSLVETLERRAKDDAAAPLVLELSSDGSAEGLTAFELLERAKLLASGWVATGIELGASVLLNLPEGKDWATHMVGLLLAGAVPVSVSPESVARRIVKRADISRARHLVTSWPLGGGSDLVTALGRRFDRVVYTAPPDDGLTLDADVSGMLEKKLVRAEALAQQGATYLDIHPDILIERTPRHGDSAAAVVFTAGSGGHPRGVVLSQGNLAAEVEALQQVVPLHPSETLLSFLGPEHVVGLVAFWWALHGGASLLYHRTGLAMARHSNPSSVILSPQGVAELIRETETLLSGHAARKLWNWALQRVEASNPGKDGLLKRLPADVAGGVLSRRFKGLFGPGMRRVFCFGGFLPEAHRKVLVFGGMDLVTGYGTTETCGVSHACTDAARGSNTAGRPLPGVTSKFSPSGEILVKGPTVARKVWTEDEGLTDIFSQDGFFHSGDFGLLDEGRLVVTGAHSDFVRTRVANVPGPDIEAMLATRPEIRRAVVVGEDRPFLAALLDVDADMLWSKTGGRGARPHDWRYWEDQSVEQYLRRVIAAVNRKLDKHEMVRSFVIVPDGFSERKEDVDSSGRVLRRNIVRRHARLIDDMYRNE